MAAGIYISVPFCAQKCTYCNFASNVFADELRKPYIEGVAEELARLDEADPDTLYFGGGSPSLLSADEFSALVHPLRKYQWSEATIEVAPGDADRGRVKAWADAGINRISFGVQSFVPEVARAAGRRHTPQTVQDEIALLQSFGISNVSIDLIAGLAHQTETTWRQSLDWVERLEPAHVSVYMLEVDDDSRLGRELQAGGSRYGATDTPSDDQITDLYLAAVERLKSLGIERYEVSNFARTGAESQHNLKYWTMQPYIGCGSDAHSFDGRRRWANAETATEYVARFRGRRPLANEPEQLGPERMLEDRILTGIRTHAGVVIDETDWPPIRRRAETAIKQGRLVTNQNHLRLTEEGFLFANEVVADLLP